MAVNRPQYLHFTTLTLDKEGKAHSAICGVQRRGFNWTMPIAATHDTEAVTCPRCLRLLATYPEYYGERKWR